MSGISGGISGLLGSIMGNDAGQDEMAKSLGLSREALAELKRLYVPTVEEQQVQLSAPELAGLLEAEQLQDSSLAGVTSDPRLKNAQMKALEELSGLSQTGLGVDDQAAFNQLRRSAGAEAQAQQKSILSNAAAQGTLDSGNTLMAQLNASQAQANRLQQGGEAQAAQAAKARRDALSQYANMSTSMANTDFNQKSTVASAKDAINKFNSQNRQDVNQYNLGNRQNIANSTADNKNKQEMLNKGLIQQQFQNNLSKATGTATQTNNLAQQYANQGTAAAQGQANMNGAILGIAGNLATGGLASPATAAASGLTAQQTAGRQAEDDYKFPKR